MSTRIIFTKLATLFFVTSIGGCATQYIPPTDGPQADLVVRVIPAVATAYSLVLYSDAENCKGDKSFVEDSNKVSISTVKLEAEKLLTFGYREVQGLSVCEMNFSFTPVTNHVYLLEISTGWGRCKINLNDSTDLKNPVPVPIKKQNKPGTRCA